MFLIFMYNLLLFDSNLPRWTNKRPTLSHLILILKKETATDTSPGSMFVLEPAGTARQQPTNILNGHNRPFAFGYTLKFLLLADANAPTGWSTHPKRLREGFGAAVQGVGVGHQRGSCFVVRGLVLVFILLPMTQQERITAVSSQRDLKSPSLDLSPHTHTHTHRETLFQAFLFALWQPAENSKLFLLNAAIRSCGQVNMQKNKGVCWCEVEEDWISSD